MRIILLTDGVYPFIIGGMQKHSAHLVKHFLLAGHEVLLVHCVNAGSELPSDETVINELGIVKENIPNLKISTLTFPKTDPFPGHYLRESFQYSKLIFNKIKDEFPNYDFVYSQGFSAWYLLLQKKKLKVNIPVGVHFHGLNMFQLQADFTSKLKSILFKKPVFENLNLADIIFSYEGNFIQIFNKLGLGNKVRIFQPIGIDERIEKSCVITKPGRRSFLFIGRNERLKGFKELIHVVQSIQADSAQFHFVGPIKENDQLIRKDCFYHGVLSNQQLNELRSKCDVLICSSYSEGMPYVVLEAMAAGLAVIATDVGAISMLVNNESGWLIKPVDKNELRKSILEAISMQDENLLKIKIGNWNRSEQFYWKNIIANTTVELEQFLKR